MSKARVFLAALAVTSFMYTPSYAGEMCHGKEGKHLEKVLTWKQKQNPAIMAYVAANKKMHKDMMSVPYTGDPDVDFVAGMVPHHQGAVDMAQVELKYGKDEDLKDLARGIIVNQMTEISMMSSWLRGRQGFVLPDAAERPTTKGFIESMHKMHAGMDIQYTGDADIDFARGMIPHHQGAIDMAEVYKPYGKYQKFEDLATNIISTQAQEIRVMEKWLECHDMPAAKPVKHHKKKMAGHGHASH